MKKTILGATLGLSMMISALPAQAAITFEDLRGHWAKDTVEFAVQDGIVDGYQDGTFKPDNSISRAEFIKMAITALQFKPADAPGNWYTPYVKSAVSNGIYIDNEFADGDMNTPITREEMARLAVRATGESNYDSKKWMYLATSKGIINGLDDSGTLGPEESTTRAQAVTVIRRVQKIRGVASLPKDKYAISRAEIVWHGTNIFTMLPRYFSNKFIDRFDISKAKWDSSDGIYHEELESYIVVDLDDPNDPFKNEIEGMQYSYPKYENNRERTTIDSAPQNAYVVYSKVKQNINGKYPENLYVDLGGEVSMTEIVPNDAIENQRSDWRQYYSEQESTNQIYFTKNSNPARLAQWHMNKGLNPYFAKNFPNEGGTFYWYSAQAIPKGDYYSIEGATIGLIYTPNLRYMKTYGPGYSGVLLDGFTDYTISNP